MGRRDLLDRSSGIFSQLFVRRVEGALDIKILLLSLYFTFFREWMKKSENGTFIAKK